MAGFFTKQETQSLTRPDGRVYSCVSCGRSTRCNSPKLGVFGEGKKGILTVLPSPTSFEDKKGEPCGNEFRYLKQLYKDIGINILKDCFITYAVACGDTVPDVYQIECCRKNLLKTISKCKPKVIIFFGNEGLHSLIGNRWKKDLGSVNKWQGYVIPDQQLNTFIAPMYPLSVLNRDDSEAFRITMLNNLKKAVGYCDKVFPKFIEPEIIYLDSLEELRNIKHTITAFDYETTGLKPHAVGHRIACCSIAVNPSKVYVFMMPKTKAERQPFLDYLSNPEIKKIAHNMKYEDIWSNVRLRTEVKGWFWDTMQVAHICDNRKSVSGLKFQTYVHLGIADYDSEINPYLKSDDNGSNSINNIGKLCDTAQGQKLLMKYCAYDSIVTYRIAMYQRSQICGVCGESELQPINGRFAKAYDLFHKGILSFSKAERAGMRIDVDYINRKQASINRKVDKIERDIKDTKFYKDWQKSVKGDINLNSGLQLGKYLYGVKKIKPQKLTDKGTPSTDDEALSALHIPECDLLLKRSKLLKISDTFLESFKREQVNGIMHPEFHLHLVKTYRSSSSNPNFQNIPKRDKVAFKTCRDSMFARKGHQLIEMDFSGMEVSIAACYHKDPNMISYLEDDSKDMHGDMAAQIFKIDDFDKHNDLHSTLRKATKNSFVFPQFYGDYYGNNATGICTSWCDMPTKGKWKKQNGVLVYDDVHLGEHLIKHGIKSFDDFTQHMKEIEDHFWNDRFQVYGQWKEEWWQHYLQTGSVSLKTGFSVQGVLNKKEVINFPIQGAAFHCLLWCFIEVTKYFEENGFDSRLIGQIHDAMVVDVAPNELIDVYNTIQRIATVELPKAWDWINVPLRIDAELCGVDESWACKHDWEPEKL